MKLIVAGQDAATPGEFAELALGFGIDAELFTGSETESPEEMRARLDAARDILRDLDPPAARFASALMRKAERRRALTWRAAA
ncbi:hypothetical protein ACFVUH_19070 [Kitasatospora sp. NPDC058032]|uniref:hypothetical protein n=1 Tax=Kitasatospora sp. NPDC058032 TaxID=3346307 RepID=UPI0036DB5991